MARAIFDLRDGDAFVLEGVELLDIADAQMEAAEFSEPWSKTHG